MKDTFESLIDAKTERVDEIINCIAAENKDYKRMTQLVKTAFEKVQSCLPDNCKNGIEQYEDAIGQREALVYQRLYEQAFQDGFALGALFDEMLVSFKGNKIENTFLKSNLGCQE
ncbi:MAG: hypothetical protein QHH06_10165 [Clostridiales bacterium]|jgi:hypothetical protein|nr:hypothetical protein [Eubacteriales bacterium]MDH7566829.1 hypothetical protein [Clostridiales bacterium]